MDWLMEMWMEMWRFFFSHPIKFLAIYCGAVFAVCIVSWLIGRAIKRIRFLRWANRQVWYVDGGGNFYRKDHSHDYDNDER